MRKQIVLKSPRGRVWRAVSDAREFGAWFKVDFDGPFAPGAHLRGRVKFPGYEHVTFDVWIEKIEPERLFSYRWHPNAIDMKKDYSREPTTLVEFLLEDVPGGTRLTITESGFDGIPLARRAEAFKGNEGGWEFQASAIAEWVGEHP